MKKPMKPIGGAFGNGMAPEDIGQYIIAVNMMSFKPWLTLSFCVFSSSFKCKRPAK